LIEWIRFDGDSPAGAFNQQPAGGNVPQIDRFENAAPFFLSQDSGKGCRLPKSTSIFTIVDQQLEDLFHSEIRTLALTGGAFGFLAEPIDDEAFLSSVRQALGE
jgi:hypothetical protein